jgi:hypothetical protein
MQARPIIRESFAMADKPLRRSQPAFPVIAFIAAVVLALIILVLRPGRHVDEPPETPPSNDAGKQMEQRLNELAAAHRDMLGRGAADAGSAQPLPAIARNGLPDEARAANAPTGVRPQPAATSPAGSAQTQAQLIRAPGRPTPELAQKDTAPTEPESPIIAPAPAQFTPMRAVENPAETTQTLIIPATSMQWDQTRAKALNSELLIYSNASARKQVTLPSPAIQMSIFARGDEARGQWPEILIWANGTVVGDIFVDSKTEQEYDLPLSAQPGPLGLEIAFINDFFVLEPREDRNVYIRQITITMSGQ